MQMGDVFSSWKYQRTRLRRRALFLAAGCVWCWHVLQDGRRPRRDVLCDQSTHLGAGRRENSLAVLHIERVKESVPRLVRDRQHQNQ